MRKGHAKELVASAHKAGLVAHRKALVKRHVAVTGNVSAHLLGNPDKGELEVLRVVTHQGHIRDVIGGRLAVSRLLDNEQRPDNGILRRLRQHAGHIGVHTRLEGVLRRLLVDEGADTDRERKGEQNADDNFDQLIATELAGRSSLREHRASRLP